MRRSQDEISDAQIDPLIAESFNFWKAYFSTYNLKLATFVIFVYFIAKKSLLPAQYFILQATIWPAILFGLGGMIFLSHLINAILKQHSYSVVQIKNRLSLWGLWMFSLIAASKVGWFSLNLDPGTVIFLSYLPAVWLFGIPRTVNGLLALISLFFVPILLIGKYDKTAEIFAVVVYFLLATAVIQGFRELRSSK
ncbi:MAG: hypothetical protein GXP43_02740 [bacterium]|nr:hypothetical protein [bacterium]